MKDFDEVLNEEADLLLEAEARINTDTESLSDEENAYWLAQYKLNPDIMWVKHDAEWVKVNPDV